MSLTREPCEPPATLSRPAIPNRQILFRHPGYDDSNNVLLKLFALDIGTLQAVACMHNAPCMPAILSREIAGTDGCRG